MIDQSEYAEHAKCAACTRSGQPCATPLVCQVAEDDLTPVSKAIVTAFTVAVALLALAAAVLPLWYGR